MADFVYDRVFEKEQVTDALSVYREFEMCVMRNCDLYSCDLSGVRFSSCRFENCNLSLAIMDNAVLQEVGFTDCKILGVRFDLCSRFGFGVCCNNCLLDNSSFRATKLKKTRFTGCQLVEVDFSECDLSGAVFDKCNLDRAVFHFTNLEKADLRTSTGFGIDPEINRLKGARFSVFGLPGLLLKYGIVIDESDNSG